MKRELAMEVIEIASSLRAKLDESLGIVGVLLFDLADAVIL